MLAPYLKFYLFYLKGLKVGHYLHIFGLHTANLNEKFKVEKFLSTAQPKPSVFARFTDQNVPASASTAAHQVYTVRLV